MTKFTTEIEELIEDTESFISDEDFNSKAEVKIAKFLAFCMIFYHDIPMITTLFESLKKSSDQTLLRETERLIMDSIERD